jgi:hypothetical protein
MSTSVESSNPALKVITNNNSILVSLLILLLIIWVLVYAYSSIKKQVYNCSLISTYPVSKINSIYTSSTMNNVALKDCHIKTAYNCCCSGDFQNDYVDECALINCAKQGVRCLDFQIYSLRGKPVVAAASLKSTHYKELYNSINFADAMTAVKRYFRDPTNCSNYNDPLFLNFRIYSQSTQLYSDMASTIQSIFGTGSRGGSLLYIARSMDEVKLSQLQNKVVIMVDLTGLVNFESSSLNPITSVKFGNNLSNHILTESDALDGTLSDVNFAAKTSSYLTMVIPDQKGSAQNYDFVTSGINLGIQFIGMCFQKNDAYLQAYNGGGKSTVRTYFSRSAIIPRLSA